MAVKPLQRDTEESSVDLNVVKNANQALGTFQFFLEVPAGQFSDIPLLKAKGGHSRSNGDDAWHVSPIVRERPNRKETPSGR